MIEWKMNGEEVGEMQSRLLLCIFNTHKRCVSNSETVCEPGVISEAVAVQSSSAGGIMELSCAASLDDAIVDTAK